MEIEQSTEALAEVAADWLVVGVFYSGQLTPDVQALDERLGGQISTLIERKDLNGKLGQIVLDPHVSEIAARRLCLVGLGSADKFDRAAVHKAYSTVALSLSKKKPYSLAVSLPTTPGEISPTPLVEEVVSALLVGAVGPGIYRAEVDRHEFSKLTIVGTSSGELQPVIDRGVTLGESINLTRELVNRHAGDIYPESFAKRTKEVAEAVGLECEIFDQSRLEQERMGSLLAVAKGSDRPPRVAVLRHNGGGDGHPTIALVGKGVTFDSGGLSLKPSDGMKAMKADMAGAATVLGVMSAISRLKLPVNVIGLMGLVENMVSGSSYKLGDVLTARNGVTIEVHNTDAEGRLVLADVLSYAVDEGVDRIIDLATLTGACVVALGEDYVGAFTNDQEWCDDVLSASKMTGEFVWQMPMDDSFNDQLRSDVADCKNVGKRWGGAITAAKFLEKFVGETPWVHLDIAGPAFAESSNSSRESGATGVMVRSLVELLESQGQSS